MASELTDTSLTVNGNTVNGIESTLSSNNAMLATSSAVRAAITTASSNVSSYVDSAISNVSSYVDSAISGINNIKTRLAPNDWRTYNGNELDVYHYEGDTDLDLPNPYVDVYTIKQRNVIGDVDRATAIAVSWQNGHQQVWMNSLHSDVQSTWAGWAPIFTPHLVWTNASQTSSFSAREVGMNIGDSKFVYIIYGESTDKPNYRNTQLAPADGWVYLMDSAKWAGTNQYPIFRSVNVTSSYISFSDAYIVQGINFAAAKDNSYLIPLYVYAL